MTTGTVRPFMRSVALSLAFALLFAPVPQGTVDTAHAADFDPTNVISNDNMRNASAMSVNEIQAFLETLPGPLATLVTSDVDKIITTSTTQRNVNLTPDQGEAPKPASQIIWEACQQWQISPKVMLAMLQKEQSLLTRTTLTPTTLARAIGAGCPNGTTNRYPGFGNQMWHGARLLSSYGEGHPSFPTYTEGMKKTIYKHSVYGTSIKPTNLATFKLYVYNPSIPGNTNFYNIYNRYFGSPFANPRIRPVYRFRNRSNGSYLYTSSATTRYKLLTPKRAQLWADGGRPFTWDSAVPTGETVPVWGFRHKKNGTYSYTDSKVKYDSRRSRIGRRTWEYKGVAFRAARDKSADSVTVYGFKNRKTGARLLITKKSTVTHYRTDPTQKRKWRYLGVAYHLPRAQVVIPTPPSQPTTPTPPSQPTTPTPPSQPTSPTPPSQPTSPTP